MENTNTQPNEQESLTVDIGDIIQNSSEPKQVAPQETKVESKPAEPEAKPDTTKVEDQPTPLPTTPPPATTQPAEPKPWSPNFTDQEKVIVEKQMTSAARQWVYARLKDLDENKGEKQRLAEELAQVRKEQVEQKSADPRESWYENPESYVLTPEYGQILADAHVKNAVVDHLKAQLIKASNGEEFQGLVYNEKGQPVVPPGTLKPTAEYVEQLRDFLEEEKYALRMLNQKKSEMKGQFQNGNVQYKQKLNSLFDQVFPDWKTFEADPAISSRYKFVEAELAKRFGANNPHVPIHAKYHTFTEYMVNMVKEAKAKESKSTTVANIQKTVGPTNGMQIDGGAGGKSKNGTYDVSEMLKMANNQ